MNRPDRHPGAYALAAARRGWHVFPVAAERKCPPRDFTAWEAQATTDPTRIRDTWSRAPYNVGIATGPSGLVVIDLDPPKPGETPPRGWDLPGIRDGADVFAALCEYAHRPFPFDTFTTRTRRGGMHLYFTAPPGVEVRNTAGNTPRGLGWCVDTRAHGGYVLGPGSFVDLPDGTGPYTVSHRAPVAPLPDWLTERLTSTPTDRPTVATPLLSAVPTDAVADVSAYVREALKGEAARVTDALPGGRNWAVNKAAYNLGRLVGAGALPADTARAVLQDAAAVHHPHGFTQAEADATVNSALAAGARAPRTLTRKGTAA